MSVVTPSYEQRKYLRENLESVRRQSYPDVEHVVVDGGSSDGTVDLLASYAEEHGDEEGYRLQWSSAPDEGQADAVNRGFDAVSGGIVGWLNSDDAFFDTGVFDRVRAYFRRTGADVVYGDAALIDRTSRLLKLYCVPSFDYAKLRRYCFIEQPAVFFRDWVLAYDRLNTSLEYAMDYEFWLRLARRYRFVHVDDVLAADRNHPERKILRDREAMLAESEAVRQRYAGSDGSEYRLGRVRDALTSGIPRRVRAVARTLSLYRDPPTFAFDAEERPLSELLGNVFRSNESLY